MNDKEIKVGEHIRTKDGCIAKVININEFREPSMKYGVEANYFKDVLFIGDDKIKKHSLNIIDLIEVGDYVNGEKVTEVDTYKDWIDIGELAREYHIKSIVTKEQFELAEYKVEE